MPIKIQNDILKIEELVSDSNNFAFNTQFFVRKDSNPHKDKSSNEIQDLKLLFDGRRYIENLSDLKYEINPRKDSIKVLAVISTSDRTSENRKISLQKRMLDNRYEEFINYENKLKEKIDYKSFISDIENNSTEYLSLYENIEDIATSPLYLDLNFGNNIIDYFRGKKSYNVGKILSWSCKNLKKDYEIESFSFTQNNFTDYLQDTIYDFKEFISNNLDQERFIVNKLLINQSISPIDAIKPNYIENTTEIVGQTLVNLGKSLFIPFHIFSIQNINDSNNFKKYNDRLNILKNFTTISEFPVIKNAEVANILNEEDNTFRINNFNSYFNINGFNSDLKLELISTNPQNYNLFKHNYTPSKFSNFKVINYFNCFRNGKVLKTIYGGQRFRLKNDVIENKGNIRISIIDKKGEKLDFNNNGSDSQTRREFYNPRSGFNFTRFVDNIDLNKVILKTDSCLSKLKIQKLQKEEVNIDFITSVTEKVVENKASLVIGNSDLNSMINVKDSPDNIFYNQEVMYNDFSEGVVIDDTNIESTRNFVLNENNISYDFINESFNNINSAINLYYPDNVLKNNYELFKKIYLDFSRKDLQRSFKEKFEYIEDMLYPKLILNKNKNNNSVANLLFALGLSKITNLDLDVGLFNDPLFNINLEFNGENSDFKECRVLVLNDISKVPAGGFQYDIFSWAITPYVSFLIQNKAIHNEIENQDGMDTLVIREYNVNQAVIPASLNARISNFIFSQINEEINDDGELEENYIPIEDILLQNPDLKIEDLRAPKVDKRFSRLKKVKENSPINVLSLRENFYKSSLLSSEKTSIVSCIVQTISMVISYFYNKDEVKNLNSQRNIVSFVKDNEKVSLVIKEIIEIYSLIYDQFFDKAFYLAVFDKTFQNPNGDLYNSKTDSIDLNTSFVDYDFKKFIDKQIIHYRKIANNIFSVSSEKSLNSILEQGDIAGIVNAHEGLVIPNNTNTTQENSSTTSNSNNSAQVSNNNFAQVSNNAFSQVSNLDQFSNLDQITSELENSVTDILDTSNIVNIATIEDSFNQVYIPNDFILIKILNILRTSDITKAAYFDIIYSYLSDTLNVQSKLEKINDSLASKITKISDIENRPLSGINISDLILLKNSSNMFLKEYYENSVKHIFIKKKIKAAKERENLDLIQFTNDVIKPYYNKKYGHISSIAKSQKDIISLGMPNTHIKNIDLNSIFKISISLVDHSHPDLISYERDFYFSPSFSANNKILKNLCINEGNSLQEELQPEIDFNINNIEENIIYFNKNASSVSNKLSLTGEEEVIRVIKDRLEKNPKYNGLSDRAELIGKMIFKHTHRSGKLETYIPEVTNFPKKQETFVDSSYEENLVDLDILKAISQVSDIDFLNIFNESKNSFLRNTSFFNSNTGQNIFDYEESDIDKTKVYTFVNNLNNISAKSDIREISELKDFYDFYFIEISPEDFLFKENIEISNFGNSENIQKTHYSETISLGDSNYLDYQLKNITFGLRKASNLKNNYNYIIKVEEI